MAKVTVTWKENMKFIGEDDTGQKMAMDASSAYGGLGQGIRPMELLLIALGGCSAIELAHILKKMRIKFDSLIIEVKGERANEHPKIFKDIEVVFRFKGSKLPYAKIYRALKLTVESYCSVSKMLEKASSISYAFELNNLEYRYQPTLANSSEQVED